MPELLPVSCGYFSSIVRQLLMKQRKMVVKYILYHTDGRAYDQLLKYAHYHSLSDLLVELMQINVAYEENGDESSPTKSQEADSANK